VQLKVSGLIDLKVAAINSSWVVGDIEVGREVFGFGEEEVTSIEMQVEEPFDSDIIASRLESDIDRDDLKLSEWKTLNEQLLSGLSGQSTSSLMIQIFVIISVVLGISSVLAITVMQKSRQIGILKAMGIKDRTASLIFLMQGFIFGVVGGAIGIAMGIGLLFIFSKFALNADGTPVVPIFIDPVFIAISGLIAVLASTVASVIPAIKSKNLSPIEVIRNG
jgi:lipoprotein-releasing system permease protein